MGCFFVIANGKQNPKIWGKYPFLEMGGGGGVGDGGTSIGTPGSMGGAGNRTAECLTGYIIITCIINTYHRSSNQFEAIYAKFICHCRGFINLTMIKVRYLLERHKALFRKFVIPKVDYSKGSLFPKSVHSK